MSKITLSNQIFHDEETAIKHLQSILWPNGPICPHCENDKKFYQIKGKGARLGLLMCSKCRKHFTVTVGTLFERSHIPIHKWLMGFYLMCSSKKGISSHQIHKMLGITYKSAWFMTHRIREAFKDESCNLLGGNDKVVEVDETFWNKLEGVPKAKAGFMHKEKIFSLVERGGSVRSFRVTGVSGKILKPIIKAQVHKETDIRSDEWGGYKDLDQHFKSHEVVRHGKGEYVRAGDIHTNTIEGFFSLETRVDRCLSTCHVSSSTTLCHRV